jgi:hypothetical protein
MSKQSASESVQPVQTVRHRNIKASIWRNETEKGPMYKVTVTRSYREGEEWRDTYSFGYDDLMNVAKLMYDAHSAITAMRAKEAGARTNVQAPAHNTLPASRNRSNSSINQRRAGT